MADSYESTKTRENFRKIDSVILAHPQLKEFLNCIFAFQTEYDKLKKELDEIINAKEGDYANPQKALQLVNVSIPTVKQKLAEKKDCLSKYIDNNNLETDTPSLIEYMMYMGNVEIESSKHSSPIEESETKWFEFGKRLRNWKKRKN